MLSDFSLFTIILFVIILIAVLKGKSTSTPHFDIADKRLLVSQKITGLWLNSYIGLAIVADILLLVLFENQVLPYNLLSVIIVIPFFILLLLPAYLIARSYNGVYLIVDSEKGVLIQNDLEITLQNISNLEVFTGPYSENGRFTVFRVQLKDGNEEKLNTFKELLYDEIALNISSFAEIPVIICSQDYLSLMVNGNEVAAVNKTNSWLKYNNATIAFYEIGRFEAVVMNEGYKMMIRFKDNSTANLSGERNLAVHAPIMKQIAEFTGIEIYWP